MVKVLRALLLCSALLGTAAEVAAQAAHPDRYELYAKLQPEAHALEGRAVIDFTNRSTQPLSFLVLHLYANAFANERTVFMRERGETLRNSSLQRRGGIDVTELRDASGADLLSQASTALVKDDATQMRVPLPRPLGPGARITLSIHFRVRLPSIVARMGNDDDFFMIAQWFPKLAKLEPDGRFASFPYHGLGEFYADFADYELTLELPRRYIVAAPGELIDRENRADGSRVERYVLRNALDFAFAAYPGFRCLSQADAAPRIDVCAPRGHLGLARQQGALLRRGLERLGRALGPYPHDRLVLVLPPSSGWGASGMEYPGLIVGWVATPFTELNPVARIAHDVTSAHELAHQWFPMLLASDEVSTPVLDEGLAEWLGLDLVRQRYDRALFERVAGAPLDLYDLAALRLAGERPPRSALEPAYRYDADALASAVYARPAVTLEAVARTWSPARLWSALSRYAHINRFGHPALPALWSAFDSAYWPGFARDTLEPALGAERCDRFVRALHGCRREPPLPARRLDPATRAQTNRWLSRLLGWAQALLTLVGP
ncbi:MAG: M1 family metallopeptidase [Polyangiales bacterium]